MHTDRSTDTQDWDQPREETSFGFRKVATGDKQPLVDNVFHSVASQYDLMNDVMSGGLHRLWKDAMVAWLAPPRSGGPYRVIDVAGGTGDIAFRIAEASGDHAEIDVVDINGSMLAVGHQRALKRSETSIRFIEANAESLPFHDGSFDAYVIAFGIRNVPRLDVALSEAFRVLRRGGRFLCLEFSQVDVPVLDRIYDLFSFQAIPRIGRVVTGDGDAYQYLVESIRTFPNQERFAGLIRNAGFDRVTYRNLSGGIAAMHSGWKL